MKKIYFIFFFVSSLIMINFLYDKVENNLLVKLIPQEIKSIVKKNIFYIAYLKKQVKEANYKILNLEKEIINEKEKFSLVEKDLIDLQQNKNLVNAKLFPNTQFIKLNYSEIKLEGIEELPNIYNIRDGKKVSSFFLEIFGNSLIIGSKLGKFFYFDINKYLNEESVFQKKIKTNFFNYGNLTVTDLYRYKDYLYVVAHNKNKSCRNFLILYSKFNISYLNFEKFYESSKPGECKNQISIPGGKIQFYKFNGKEGFLIASRDLNEINYFLLNQYGNDKEYKDTNVMFLDFDKKTLIPFASGLRNPMGFLVNSKNVIIATESGPRGGDEINKIKFKKNYGWPDASYGENYYTNYQDSEGYKFKKNHEELGFEEPLFAFTPSVTPTEIIEIDEGFSKKWKGDYIMGSLRSQSLYRIKFDKNFNKVLTIEQIFINKRVRDIVYDKKNKLIYLAQENDKGSLGIVSVDKSKN